MASNNNEDVEAMDVESSQDHVRELIETYPDVQVRSAEIIGDFSVIEFFTPSIDSLARLSHVAWASNAVITVAPPYSEKLRYGKEMNSSELVYQLKLEPVFENSPPSQLQIFGIFMARDLEAFGLISEEKLDFLMKSWKGVRKPKGDAVE